MRHEINGSKDNLDLGCFLFQIEKTVNATWKSKITHYECKHIKRHTHIYKSTQLAMNNQKEKPIPFTITKGPSEHPY